MLHVEAAQRRVDLVEVVLVVDVDEAGDVDLVFRGWGRSRRRLLGERRHAGNDERGRRQRECVAQDAGKSQHELSASRKGSYRTAYQDGGKKHGVHINET